MHENGVFPAVDWPQHACDAHELIHHPLMNPEGMSGASLGACRVAAELQGCTLRWHV
jgi:hypothetical protein